MIEFGYYAKNGENRPILRDEIQFIHNENDEIFISNCELKNSKIVAKEIDFYIKNSLENTINKANGVKILYETKALLFDYAKDKKQSKNIGKNIVIISDENEENLQQKLVNLGFKAIILRHKEIKFMYGQIGEIYINLLSKNGDFEINCDIALIKNAKNYMLSQSGCYEICELNDDEILNICKQISPVFEYRNFIVYDEKMCDFHHRRTEICAKCAQICPKVAILANLEKNELVFSHIDCVNCGKCVSICPTGAIDFALMTRECFDEVTNLYKNTAVLMLDENCDLSQEISLPSGVLPLIIEQFGFVDYSHFMTLLCKSAHSIVVYAQNSFINQDSVDFINEIFMRKFSKQAIFVARNLSQLQAAFSQISAFDAIIVPNLKQFKRENFAAQLKILAKNDDFSIIKTPKSIEYAEISVNQDTCTLCLSCVVACNTGALIADSMDNSLKFNPSLCTSCAYCVKSCAENDTIFIKTGEISLNKMFFEYKILARDELFKCICCNKEFATKKSIQKVANAIKPLFKGDDLRIKTLYCCSDCKAKMMIEEQFKTQEKALNG